MLVLGFTEDTWKTYCLKQKQLRQDYKPQPILEDSVTNNEIVVLGEKPMPLKKELIMPHEFEGFAPPVFHPLLMPPPVMPHLGGMLPPVCTVPQLDPLGLGPPPLHLPPNVLPPFQPDVSAILTIFPSYSLVYFSLHFIRIAVSLVDTLLNLLVRQNTRRELI